MSETMSGERKVGPAADWKWYGHAAHFICGHDCRFHMATEVGGFLVSTIGEYLPDANVREILAASRGVVLEGRGDERRADYMQKVGYEKIGGGPDAYYETYVFRIGAERCNDAECGACGLPRPTDWREIDGRRWATAGEATRGHMEYCAKYAIARATEAP